MLGNANCVYAPVSDGVSFVSEALALAGNWVSRTNYEGDYPYMKTVNVVKATDMTVNSFKQCLVAFDEESATSGLLSPVCQPAVKTTADGKFWQVTIFAKEAITGTGTFVVTFIA